MPVRHRIQSWNALLNVSVPGHKTTLLLCESRRRAGRKEGGGGGLIENNQVESENTATPKLSERKGFQVVNLKTGGG